MLAEAQKAKQNRRVTARDSKIKGVTGKPEAVPYHEAVTAFIFELGLPKPLRWEAADLEELCWPLHMH